MPESDATEQEISLLPVGYRYELAVIAFVKHALITLELTAPQRLEVLERLSAMVDHRLTPDVLAAVDPAGDIEAAIVREALSLDRSAAFDLLAGPSFGKLAQLNPSLITAGKLLMARPARALH